MDHNINFFGSDQIQTPQYPDVQENPLTNDEFEAFMKENDDKINNLETKFDHFQKQCEQMQDDLLNQMRNFMQNFQNGPPGEDKEHEAITDTELFSTEDIQPLPVQEPPQNSDMHQIIEGCCVEASEEQKQKMEDTMLDLVKICHHKYMGYEHLNITPETKSDEVTESNAENLLPIPNECEVALEDKRECDLFISKNSPVCDNSDTFSDSEINDDISVYDDDFKNIEYVEASLSNPEIVNVEEENVVQQKEEEVDLEDISQVQDIVLREKLLSITRLISNIKSLNDNSIPDRVFNSFESDNSLLDNFSPEFETFCDHSEETRSGNTTHANYSLLEYDSFCFEIEPDQERLINLMKNDVPDNSDSILSHELSDDNFEDNPSILRPPPEPPDDNFDLEPKVISAVMEDIDEPDEHFNPEREINVSTKIEDDNYFPFMIVI
nr:hypothetical protein [Tanacetum cinerariifolium]